MRAVTQLDPRLGSAQLHADQNRLEAQARLSWTRESKALARAGLRDGMAILEVGPGPGFITGALLGWLPHSSVTAVELDAAMCQAARDRLDGAYGDRLELVHSSILYTGLPSDVFDFAIARLVLQHVAAPDLALAEVFRLLKPGGVVAVLDIDDGLGGIVSPRLPAFEVVAHKVRRIQAANAGDREIGRKLWGLLAAAGFSDLDLETIAVHSAELGIAAFLPQYHPDRYRPFVTSNAISTEEFGAYEAAFQVFLADPEAFILQLLMLAHGRKQG